MTPKTFYITCAIDYVNSNPHLGTAYEKIAADALARYHRLVGDDVYFLMGTDEHSLNVERAARKQGMEPLAYTDTMAARFEEVWRSLELSYDVFIRTSEGRHHRSVQELFRRINDRGDIFKGKYEGYYCVGCEGFKQEKDLLEGLCPCTARSPTGSRRRTTSSGSLATRSRCSITSAPTPTSWCRSRAATRS